MHSLALLVRLARWYYALCLAGGCLALVPDRLNAGLPRLARVARKVLLNSVGRGRTYDEDFEGASGSGRLSRFVRSVLSASVPKRWFSHFYHLAFCWNGAWLLLLLKAVLGGDESETLRETLLALICLQVHVSRRLYENYFVHIHSNEARMQLFGYSFGLLYYVFLPANFLSPVAAAFEAAGAGAGAALGDGAATGSPRSSDATSMMSGGPPSLLPTLLDGFGARQGLCLALFIFGNVMQYQSHCTLASIRKGGGQAAPGKSKYSVPQGLWFTHCSSPHYLAEILLYVGFITLSTGWGADTLLLMTMVVMNLGLSAGMTHQWYKATFKTYPKARWAMVPLIY
mmetsp:Transcript_4768/g.12015  ORF Transcript_4768/g.12015 Transcript_4768/m.12015 type:complete len:342 (-) Transcript_4768:42-1067(-)